MLCKTLLARLQSGPMTVEEGEYLLGNGNNLKVQIHKLRRLGLQIETIRQRQSDDGRRGKGLYVLHANDAEAATAAEAA